MSAKPLDSILTAYKTHWPITAIHETNLRTLLSNIQADTAIQDVRWAAYMLATCKWEVWNTYAPIEEFGKGEGHPYGAIDPLTRQAYYGRGFVQLTWADNYKTFGSLLGIDLYQHPDLALQPDVAYKIMSLGMVRGLFTGLGLSRFINDTKCEYLYARQIINGMDEAEKIAGYAEVFQEILS